MCQNKVSVHYNTRVILNPLKLLIKQSPITGNLIQGHTNRGPHGQCPVVYNRQIELLA